MTSVGYEHLVKWKGSIATAPEYLGFFEPLGFEAFTRLPYSPFRYEVVEVSEAPEEDGVTVDHVFWPGLMFGEMMFSRAGLWSANHARAHLAKAGALGYGALIRGRFFAAGTANQAVLEERDRFLAYVQ